MCISAWAAAIKACNHRILHGTWSVKINIGYSALKQMNNFFVVVFKMFCFLFSLLCVLQPTHNQPTNEQSARASNVIDATCNES